MKIFYKLISAMTVCLLVISVTLSVSAETSVNNMMNLQNIIELDIFKYSEDLEIKENYSGAEKAVIFEKGTLIYEFSVSEASDYNLFLDYKVISDNDMNAEISVLIDGEVPFEGAERIEIRKMWTDGGEIRKDNYGNEFTPEQSEYDGFVNTAVYDATGIISEPYLFNLSKGEHTITLELKDGKIALSGITFEAVENTDRTYKDIETEYKENGYKAYEGKTLVLEGENAWLKNSDSIIALADNSSKILTPSSATHSKINYIGSSNWKNLNDEITWQIDIPEDGLYKLGFMCKQDQTINGNAYRSLKIDGKTPFKEAKVITFGYDINWKFKEFSNVDDEPYLFYLTKGEHTLSLSVTLGPTAEFYARLKEVTQTLGDLYIDMVMITGETPDKNRDYELHKQIPDFLETLKNTNKAINDIAVDMQELTGEGTNSQIAALKNMSRVLESMVKNSYTAHIYMQDFYSNYTTVSSWLYEMTMMPLSIDQIRIAAPDKAFEEKSVSFGEKLIFAIKRFLVSFTEEYQSSKIKSDKNGIKIWVNWGNDQAQVLKSLIEESFTPKTGIPVNLEIVNADLIKGMLSDNQPDLSLQMSRATPVNYAMRGALYDLTNFEDYEEVLERFGESAAIPYWYENGLYALPDQQSFYLMFYRSDILDEMNIEVPKTWDEFMAATAILQRNNMNSYIPYTKISAATTTDTGVGGLNLFASILMQHSGQIYNESKTESTLLSKTTLKAFKYWTNMYTQFKIPIEADFYNRFKAGTSPLGIALYTTYTTILQEAPEIQGRWGIALVPGMKQEDGSINRTVSGAGTACAILEKSEHKKEAWEFLKWWTDADTQVRYNKNVESILGAVSRITTANVEAFSRMGWQKEDLQILLEQREQIQEIPEMPGSYFLTRSVDQAFFAVYNGTSSPKDALTKWGREANNEIARKMAEY